MIAFFVAAWLAADPVIIEGLVVDVHDGDTMTVELGGGDRGRLRVRLAGIDAPELGQAHGPEARDGLRELVAGRRVRVATKGRDRYGRTIGDVYAGETHVNQRMIEFGHAWQYRRFDRSAKFAGAQLDAAEAGRGLWARGTNVTPPWEWRAARRTR